MSINDNLADRLSISEDARENIAFYHQCIEDLFRDIKNGEYYSTPKNIALRLEVWEFRLQELWGFAQDSAYHKYWFLVPGCTCPKLDNSDRFGTGYNVINCSCPYHGENVK